MKEFFQLVSTWCCEVVMSRKVQKIQVESRRNKKSIILVEVVLRKSLVDIIVDLATEKITLNRH